MAASIQGRRASPAGFERGTVDRVQCPPWIVALTSTTAAELPLAVDIPASIVDDIIDHQDAGSGRFEETSVGHASPRR